MSVLILVAAVAPMVALVVLALALCRCMAIGDEEDRRRISHQERAARAVLYDREARR